MKKILCILLTFLLILSMLPAAFADEEETTGEEAVEDVVETESGAGTETDAEPNNEESNDLWADRETFYEYKASVLQNLRNRYAFAPTDAENAVYGPAINAIDGMYYDESKSLSENEARINTILGNVNSQIACLNEPADYSEVDRLLDSFPSGEFTAESTDAWDVACRGVNRNYKRSQQSYVDAMAQKLRAALAGLVPVNSETGADYSAVDAALASIPSNLSAYTDASVAAVNSAKNAVVRGLSSDKQSQVDAMAQAIRNAVSALVLKPVGADYSAVDAALSSIPSNLSNYTDATVAAVNSAKNAVVRGLSADKQSQVDAMAQNIRLAVSGLKLKNADYTAVDAALSSIPSNLSNYTDSTVTALNSAKSMVVRGYTIDKQAQVDTMAQNIRLAVSGLKLKEADYSAVDAALASIPSDLTNYTSATVSAVNTAKNAVVRGYTIDKQTQVNAMAQAIRNAVSALKLKGADYSAVDAALASVPSNLSNYTDATVSALNTAKNAVVRGYTIDKQSEVDAMAARINTAVRNLMLRSADYSAVDAAIGAIPANLSDYTDATVSAVNSAKNAVVRGYTIDRQAEVDVMASRITQATGALQLKAVADFLNAKAAAVSAAHALGASSSSDTVRGLVNAAVAAINALSYDSSASPAANLASVSAILTRLESDIEAQMRIETMGGDGGEIIEEEEEDDGDDDDDDNSGDGDKENRNKGKVIDNTAVPTYKPTPRPVKTWEEGIAYCEETGLMDGTFDPDAPASRAMAVLALWRLAGEPVPDVNIVMSESAIANRWAITEEILPCYDESYDFEAPVTREELAAMLYAFAQKEGDSLGEDHFPMTCGDAAEISPWAEEAVIWCCENGILTGESEGRFAPAETVTVGEAANAIMHLCQRGNKSGK